MQVWHVPCAIDWSTRLPGRAALAGAPTCAAPWAVRLEKASKAFLAGWSHCALCAAGPACEIGTQLHFLL
jgi:hypothetical protein